MPAGYAVPLYLTVKQERYCCRTIGITRFIYNLCVATHRFCRTNRMAWPSWQDLYKAFNAAKREDYPFSCEVASRVQDGAFMDFGAALRNWRDPGHPTGLPRFGKKRTTGTGSFRAVSGVAQLRYYVNSLLDVRQTTSKDCKPSAAPTSCLDTYDGDIEATFHNETARRMLEMVSKRPLT